MSDYQYCLAWDGEQLAVTEPYGPLSTGLLKCEHLGRCIAGYIANSPSDKALDFFLSSTSRTDGRNTTFKDIVEFYHRATHFGLLATSVEFELLLVNDPSAIVYGLSVKGGKLALYKGSVDLPIALGDESVMATALMRQGLAAHAACVSYTRNLVRSTHEAKVCTLSFKDSSQGAVAEFQTYGVGFQGETPPAVLDRFLEASKRLNARRNENAA